MRKNGESQRGSGGNGTQEGAALLARGTCPGAQSHSAPLSQTVLCIMKEVFKKCVLISQDLFLEREYGFCYKIGA